MRIRLFAGLPALMGLLLTACAEEPAQPAPVADDCIADTVGIDSRGTTHTVPVCCDSVVLRADSGIEKIALWLPAGDTSLYYTAGPNETVFLRILSAGDTVEDQIDVVPLAGLDIPNSFTPNADDLNDQWRPLSPHERCIAAYNLRIYDTQNDYKLVAQSAGNEASFARWDGTDDGVRLPAGLYYYELEVRYRDNRLDNYEGDLNLIR